MLMFVFFIFYLIVGIIGGCESSLYKEYAANASTNEKEGEIKTSVESDKKQIEPCIRSVRVGYITKKQLKGLSSNLSEKAPKTPEIEASKKFRFTRFVDQKDLKAEVEKAVEEEENNVKKSTKNHFFFSEIELLYQGRLNELTGKKYYIELEFKSGRNISGRGLKGILRNALRSFLFRPSINKKKIFIFDKENQQAHKTLKEDDKNTRFFIPLILAVTYGKKKEEDHELKEDPLSVQVKLIKENEKDKQVVSCAVVLLSDGEFVSKENLKTWWKEHSHVYWWYFTAAGTYFLGTSALVLSLITLLLVLL